MGSNRVGGGGGGGEIFRIRPDRPWGPCSPLYNMYRLSCSGVRRTHRRLTRKPRAAGDSRPVEAIARDGQFDKTNRVRR